MRRFTAIETAAGHELRRARTGVVIKNTRHSVGGSRMSIQDDRDTSAIDSVLGAHYKGDNGELLVLSEAIRG
jgi:hypothetical protein